MGADSATPVEPEQRSHFLDGLRGLALFGILIVNMAAFIGFGMNDEAGRAAAIGSAFDDFAEVGMEWLFTGKFYSIFSLLFGIGFSIQLGRLQARGEGVPRYVRRLLILFGIGMGISSAPAQSSAMATVTPDRAGMAAGLSSTMRYLGGIATIAVQAVVLGGDATVTEGRHQMMVVLYAAAALGSLVVASVLPRRPLGI